ncbi:MAG: hypothetical protein RL410_1219 [Actinomycetota bacterium]|jgi:pantoate--beta-alanine ligase
MKIINTVADMKSIAKTNRRGAVFTMGALHAGHRALIEQCRSLIGDQGQLVVSVFVNPTQFTNQNDLLKYPRTIESDIQLCESAGVDYLFVPSVDEMYPSGVTLPQLTAGNLGTILEGASRPGHFDAVATVVHRLLDITTPDVTCFGEKDYQQLAVVRAMVKAHHMKCDVVGVATVRDYDGLALSSRNVRLTTEQRAAAVCIPRALEECARIVEATGDTADAIDAGIRVISAEKSAVLDYFEIRSTELAQSPQSGEARALVAVSFGDVRLIDNYPVNIGRVQS